MNRDDPVVAALRYCAARLNHGPYHNPNDGLIFDVDKAIAIAEQQMRVVDAARSMHAAVLESDVAIVVADHVLGGELAALDKMENDK